MESDSQQEDSPLVLSSVLSLEQQYLINEAAGRLVLYGYPKDIVSKMVVNMIEKGNRIK